MKMIGQRNLNLAVTTDEDVLDILAILTSGNTLGKYNRWAP